MTTNPVLEVGYNEGWDPESRTIVGPLRAATARARNDRGEPYAIALIVPETGLPKAVLEIAWQQRFARGWLIDEQERRHTRVEFRQLADGRLFTMRTSRWEYQTPDQPEFADDVRYTDVRSEPDGRTQTEVRDRFDIDVTQSEVDIGELFRPVPAFDDLPSLVPFEEPVELRPRPDPDAEDPTANRPWQPPVPRRPIGLAELFTPDTKVSLEDIGDAVTVVRDGGTLRLPSGRVVAADPVWLGPAPEAFTVTVEPGEYPVRLAVLRFAGERPYERTAAAKLVIADEPVVSWELAVGPGQDPILLADKEFYGFGVDAGMGCFVDASAAEALGVIVEESKFGVKDFGRAAELVDPESGANLIAYSSGFGDGCYPVWIGRTAGGAVACFVADMLLVSDPSEVAG